MNELIGIVSAIADYWLVLLWAVLVIGAFFWGGWKVALGVATLGLATIAYTKGRTDERAGAEAVAAVKERKDVEVISKNRTEVQSLSDKELNREVDKWTRK